MSRAHQYHQPNAPDPPAGDSDSDVDLDLEELDPITSSNGYPSRQGQRREEGPERTSKEQIPLRNLHTWEPRGLGRRIRGLRRYNEDRNNEEDLEGLLDDGIEPGPRDSAGSLGPTEDIAPLLPHDADLDSGRHGMGTIQRRISSRLRLPSFVSGQSRQACRQGRPQDGGDDKEDIAKGTTRNIRIGQYPAPRFPPNAVSNAKYTPWSFLPRTLYNEFSFFFNMYFLLVALSQIIPPLRIGYLSTYVAPLAFVLVITLGKEALDDIARRRRDAEANKEEYMVLHLQDISTGPSHKGRKRGKARLRSKKARRRAGSSGHLSAIEEEESTLEGGGIAGVSNTVVNEIKIKSRDLKVGDVLKLGKDQRVPADLVILKSYTNESAVAAPSNRTSSAELLEESGLPIDPIGEPPVANTAATEADARQSTTATNSIPSADAGGVGETFIRTDQLDGETDWKLRLASPVTQSLDPREFTRLRVLAGKPEKKVNEFVGTVELAPKPLGSPEVGPTAGQVQTGDRIPNVVTAPLTIDNTAWANTVLASNATVLAVVVYTGAQTRQALSTSPSRSKTGLLEYEINNLTKILCALTLALSIILVALEGFNKREDQEWYVAITRFLILFSTIIPISLRVNLDMGKSVYAWFIERDQDIPGAVVRTSTIPEELGRIEYLLSDKTGTLTQNEMELKKIHVGTVSYANEAMEEVGSYVQQGFWVGSSQDPKQPAKLVTPSSVFTASSSNTASTRTRREIGSRVRDIVLALALCHNVTPTTEEVNGQTFTAYQASSPDEIAIIKWTESVGLRLLHRDRHTITLQSVDSSRVAVRVRILEVFPFTSEGKRMGIIAQFVQDSESTLSPGHDAGEIYFYQKGADTVMASIVAANDWLDEETANMAREGLRTLVVGRKKLSPQQFRDFSTKYKQASVSLQDRDTGMARVVKDHLEHNLELLGVTGVEDKLQKDVKPSLELLRNAGIKIWMLTGDKVETARCVAVSAKLVSRTHYIHTITNLTIKSHALDHLTFLRSKPDACLLIDGSSLTTLLKHHRTAFISIAVLLPAVIACRCSPTQKADIASLIRAHTHKRVCCIGDGGNDVSMIQAADIGVGIVGKEGRQASLAADFSITSFHHLTKLLVWHGRNSYKRSAKLAQFVIHRGLIISVCQTVYSIATSFEPHALYRDWLLVGYATVYTMAPVFSLVLDKDVDEGLANLYPELYKELTSGASLSYRTFFVWLAISIYQGLIIQGLSQLLVGRVDSPRMVSVSYTVLVINELIMVAAEVVTWHWVMVVSIAGTMAVYVASVPFLGDYFDLAYVWTWGFAWRVAAISAVSLGPPYAGKILRRTLRPPSYRKVREL
ncbi:putative aminophospholipid-translocase [Hypocenomyce scalaris]|nr:putative aminophospholipid-translocase [Hypocenomyce scalaris]